MLKLIDMATRIFASGRQKLHPDAPQNSSIMAPASRAVTEFHGIKAVDSPTMGFLSRHEIVLDSLRPKRREDSQAFRILNHFSEPPPLIAADHEVIAHAEDYDLILTYSDAVCRAVRHATLFPHGSRWVEKDSGPKRPGVSFIFSEGASGAIVLPGYDQRVEVLNRLVEAEKSEVEVFYGTRRGMRSTSRAALLALMRHGVDIAPITDSKLPAFNTQYQIVIENYAVKNWFTEKIVDCFARKVTPIYIGCPNIGDFFDQRAILSCTSVSEALEYVRAIKGGQSFIDESALEINYLRSDYYSDIAGRIRTLAEARLSSG